MYNATTLQSWQSCRNIIHISIAVSNVSSYMPFIQHLGNLCQELKNIHTLEHGVVSFFSEN